MRLARAFLNLLRLLFLVQLVLGIIIWAGHGAGLINAHMIVGVLFVIALWTIAIVALTRRRAVGLAIFAIIWGLVIAGFGGAQVGMLPGSSHWIIRVVHLLIAIVALPIGERLARES